MKKPDIQFKSVGVGWFSQIPANWDVASLKWISKLYAGGTPDKEKAEYWSEGTIPWLNSGAVNQWKITEPSAYITEEAYRNSSAKWIPKDAVVIALAGQGKTKGMVAQVEIETTCNQSMAAIVPDSRENPRFLLWWLATNYETIRNLAGGEQRDGLNLEMVGGIPCPIPPNEEQEAIADLLDRETARLDALVAAKERWLELLVEKRRALITRAVTRGLNPRAPVQDSGKEWLGQVPKHWKIDRLKFHLRRIEQGWSPQCENYPAEGEDWGVMKAGCVNGWEFDPTENKRLPDDLDPALEYEIKPGDVLMSRANTTELLGSTALVRKVRPHLLLCDKLYRLDVNKTKLDKEFLVAYLRSSAGRFEFERDATGASSSMQNIGQDSVRNVWISIPPTLEEQRAIVTYISGETAKLDALRASTQRTLDLLKERRAALIAAAVTGNLKHA